MYNLSNYIDKSIVNVTNAQDLGFLSNVVIRDTKITHIITSNGDYIAVDDIRGMGDYIACVSSGTSQDNCASLTPIGKKAIFSNGITLGEIMDYCITKDWKLSKVITEVATFSANRISSIGTDYLVIEKKTQKKAPKLAQVNRVQADTAKIITEQSPVPASAIPKVVSDYSFLCGRVLSRDIYLGNGKRLFCTYTTITENIINLAKVNNKLVELTLYSQKNA